MNLGQMRLEVRRAVAELTADLWSDAEINDWLNEGAKIMASLAQSVQAVYQFTTVALQQEYVLPDDVDEVFNVTYFDSSLEPLLKIDPRFIQQGTVSNGRTKFFFIKDTTKTAQQTDTGISIADPDPDNPNKLKKTIGLFPIPSAAKQVTVFYYSRHFQMATDGAVPAIPPEFRRGIVAYATSLAKEKEAAYAEADRKRQEFKDFSDRLAAKMISEGQEVSFPTVRTDDMELPFGDVIYKFGRAT